jgi:hypothetical protein
VALSKSYYDYNTKPIFKKQDGKTSAISVLSPTYDFSCSLARVHCSSAYPTLSTSWDALPKIYAEKLALRQ